MKVWPKGKIIIETKEERAARKWAEFVDSREWGYGQFGRGRKGGAANESMA